MPSWIRLVAVLAVFLHVSACTFEPSFAGYCSCGQPGACPAGCDCLSGQVCVPNPNSGLAAMDCCSPDPDCDDGNPCTCDVRLDGQCRQVPLTHPDEPACDDDNACTDDACRDGACAHENNAIACDDGLYCNGIDTCSGGACTHAGDPCQGGDACNSTCNEASDDCLSPLGTPCDDDRFCTETDACEAGTCVGTGNACDPLACDEYSDSCLECSFDSDCNDSNPCTDDVCVAGYCLTEANAAPCDDGLFCNGTDTCAGGVCTHTGDPCLGGPACLTTCNETSGECLSADNTLCDDGLFCTLTDTCQAGICVGTGNPCPNGICDEIYDLCQACVEPSDCDDGNPCTDDSCTSNLCSFVFNDAPCDDGLYCTGVNHCDAGACEPGLNPCVNPEICLENLRACVEPGTWQGLGDSDFGPWSDFIWSSAWGGGISRNLNKSENPSLALDPDGDLFVAWQDLSNPNYEIYVMRHETDSDTWTRVGDGSHWGGGISNNDLSSTDPSLALNASGLPLVAWVDHSGGGQDIYVKRFNGTHWTEVGPGSASSGGISNTSGACTAPSLDLDPDGLPIVAWSDDTPGHAEIFVKRFDGSSWVEAGDGTTSGGISGNAQDSLDPCLAVDSSGHPVVAWSQHLDDDTRQIYLRRFDGVDWLEVGVESASNGGISASGGVSVHPRLALDTADHPVVVWEEVLYLSHVIYIMRFDGANWQEVGTGSASGSGIGVIPGSSYRPSLAMNQDDNPVVAWSDDYFGDQEIYIMQFDTDVWVGLGGLSAYAGGISDNTGNSAGPSLAVGELGRVVAAWDDLTSGSKQIYVKQHISEWQSVGSATITTGGLSEDVLDSSTPSLAWSADGLPVVAWKNATGSASQIYLRRYDSDGWGEWGVGSDTSSGISLSTGDSVHPSLAISSGGTPVVAWQDDHHNNQEIHVKHFDGLSWTSMDPDNPMSVNISSNDGDSSLPSLALDTAGHPMVAWQDDTSGNPNIYVRKYNGESFVELGPGSATGGGISSSAFVSKAPSLAVDADGRPYVAWQEAIPGRTVIYLKWYNGSEWLEKGAGSASGGGISTGANSSTWPSLILDADGNPIVAWSCVFEVGNSEIYLKRFADSTWEELEGSASGPGISASWGDSVRPRLALYRDEHPVVTWMDSTPGRFEIYVKAFDGASWRDLGPGSSINSGISSSSANSTAPGIISADSHVCVAWNEGGPHSMEILLRCFFEL